MNMLQPARHPLFVAAIALTAVAGAAGCSKSEAAPARPSPPAEGASVTGPRAETDNYVAEIAPGGAYKAGAEGTVEVILTPKASYHINESYPYKFKAADPPPEGVTFPKPTLLRADGTFEAKKGKFKVPFVASKAGKVTIGGTLHLSVCSDANCIIDKVALEVPVDVK